MTPGNRRPRLDRSFIEGAADGRRDRIVARKSVLCLALLALAGCAGESATASRDADAFLERRQVQSDEMVRVAAAVPSAAEARELFGVSLYSRGVQPVWLEIENRGRSSLSFLPAGLDPVYFTAIETAVLQQRDPQKLDPALSRQFFESGMPTIVTPGEIRSGFVFSRLDEGTKAFNVDLVGDDDTHHSFTFFIPVPGLRIDHHSVDWDGLYDEAARVDQSDAGLKRYLESLPCCTTDSEAKGQGDPLNIVVIGDPEDVYYAFIRAGWDETESVYRASAIRTAFSFLFGGEYRYSPVSGLYVFGRSQDVALQKARGTIHERNHLRLWMTPMSHQGKPVWIGQISRDIGVRFSAKTIVTHKIDPDVDETREFLIENLAYAQSLARIGYVSGVGAAAMDAPRRNLTGDPYFTDGSRVVLWVSSRPVDIADIEIMPWPFPHDE
ncbi:MAG: LssY C-terminal domain-containing protein [Rhodospirillales bacterium]|nr:MAG: LssY C-terminal domain-containing protein [Rhodospirillales bacterium]